MTLKKIVHCTKYLCKLVILRVNTTLKCPMNNMELQLPMLIFGSSFSPWLVDINFNTSQLTLGPSIESYSSFEKSSDFVDSSSFSKRFLEFDRNKNLESKYLEHTTPVSLFQNLTVQSICSFRKILFIIFHHMIWQKMTMPLSMTKVPQWNKVQTQR